MRSIPTLTRRRLTGDGATSYAAAIRHVRSQLEPQITATCGESKTLALLPAVGFAGQSRRVLGRTLDVLSRQDPATPLQTVVLINRPLQQPPDSTEAIVRAAAERHAGNAHTVAVATVALAHRPRMGELRQLLLDATQAVLAEHGARGDQILLLDDDIVDAPWTFAGELSAALEGGSSRELAVGPVLFDDPEFPSAFLPDFLAADLFRALLSAAWVERVAAADLTSRGERETLAGLARGTFETIVLSCNLAVRPDAVSRIDGFRDLNEITGLACDIQERRLSTDLEAGVVNSISATFRPRGDRVDALLSQAVRISSRRALAAYACGRHPPVAQWRACRFRSSRVDPVRLSESPTLSALPIRLMGRTQRAALVTRIEEALRATLPYFPPDLGMAATCLAQLELGSGSTRLSLVNRHDPDWRFSIVRHGSLLERLADLQLLAASAEEEPGLAAAP